MSSKPKYKGSKSSHGRQSHREQMLSNPNYYNRDGDNYESQRQEEIELGYQGMGNQSSDTTTVTMPYFSSPYSHSTGGKPNHKEIYVVEIANTSQLSTSYSSESVQKWQYHDDRYQLDCIGPKIRPSSYVATKDVKWQQPSGSTGNIPSYNHASQTPRSTSQQMPQDSESGRIQEETARPHSARTCDTADSVNFQINETSPEADEGTLFGRLCEDIGILKGLEDTKHRKTRGSRRSLWNPERLQSNCFFVCIGKLLNKAWGKLSRKLDLPTLFQLQGVRIGEIEQIIQKIGGLRVVVLPGMEEYGDPTYQQEVAFGLLSEQWFHLYENQSFILGYRRSDVIGPSAGHCIIAKHVRGGGHRLSHYRFACYQNDDKGKCMSEDVRRSYIKFAIFKDESPIHMEFYHETPDKGVFNHAQLSDEIVYSTSTRASDLAKAGSTTSTPYPSYNYPALPARPATMSLVPPRLMYSHQQSDNGRYH